MRVHVSRMARKRAQQQTRPAQNLERREKIRNDILEILKQHPNRAMDAQDIRFRLLDMGHEVERGTVTPRLEKLAEEKLVSFTTIKTWRGETQIWSLTKEEPLP